MALFSRLKKIFSAEEEAPNELTPDMENNTSDTLEENTEADSASEQDQDGCSSDDNHSAITDSPDSEVNTQPCECTLEENDSQTGETQAQAVPVVENEVPNVDKENVPVADNENTDTDSVDSPDTQESGSEDHEPENSVEQEQESFFSRVFKSLARTRKRLAARLLSLFGANKIDDNFWDELEEILISADVGMEPTLELTKRLKARLRKDGILNPAEVPPYLHQEIAAVFAPVRETEPASPQVVLVIGVNGVGKTTTIAKLAYLERERGKKVLIAAADTFRAAAVEQLETWAKRVGCRFYAKGQGADPAAVAYEALDVAQKEHVDIVFVDTAGRLHTKTNLMEELLKIRRVLNKRMPGAPHRSILVMDATTGQNGLSQAKLFGESCGIDELILTKLDGTAKGGIAVAVAMQFGIPISHVGLGEGMCDLRPFEPETFTKALLDTKE